MTLMMVNEGIGPSVIWRNWVSNQMCRVKHFSMPATDEEVSRVIRSAAGTGLGLRVVGSGHSYAPLVPTDGVIMSAERLSGIESIDQSSGLVTLRGGTRICDVGQDLRAAGWALPNQGDIDVQTLSGAMATGTHGSGDDLQCMAGSITAMRIAVGDGAIVTLSEDNDIEAFRAAQVSLGLMGVVLAITMKLVPAYDLHEKIWRADFEDCAAELDSLCRENRSVRAFWCASEHSASLFSLPDTSAIGRTARRSDVCEMRTLNVTPEAPQSVSGKAGERIGPSYRIYPALPMPNHNECEYAVPYEDGVAVFREIRKLIQTRYPSQIFPVEFRTVAADDIWMSPCHGRRTAMISVSAGAGEDYWDFIRDCESIFATVKGRPHWGKLHTLGRREIEDLYPRHGAFVDQRHRFDPQGRFLNDYLRGLFA